jgi:uncharacterized protein YbaR (Trm112 family)
MGTLGKQSLRKSRAEILSLEVRGRIVGMIDRELLEILVCPACKKPLVWRENPESLKCTQCRRVYPVKDNIPVLLIDEAVTEPS